MNNIDQSSYQYQSAAAAYEKSGVKSKEKSQTEAKAEVRSAASQEPVLKDVPGRTIGNPKLSEEALAYYEELKKKYGNMDFILVSPEMKEEAERNKGMYASSKELLVLIDSDKIEQMARDENVRKQYESILDNATSQIRVMKRSLGSNAKYVKSFGMTIDDQGLPSLFAVIDKSLAQQRERITENKEESRKAAKEAAKKKSQEKKWEKQNQKESQETVTVTAGSWNELLKKIDKVVQTGGTDIEEAGHEKKIGQKIDFAL